MVALKGTQGGQEWHLAGSLVDLVRQVDAAYPGRDKAYDGSIGDAAHAARKSEHNPDTGGVVRAVDLTRESEDMAVALIAAVKMDPRAWYVIHRRVIWSRTHDWQPQPYAGDPHEHHLHVSVRGGLVGAKPGPWSLGRPVPAKVTKPADAKVPRTLMRGKSSPAEVLGALQRFLGVREAGYGDRTKMAVIRYQRQHDLVADGVVGPKTWAVILTALKLPGYNA